MLRIISGLFRNRRSEPGVAGDFVAFVTVLPECHRVRHDEDMYSDLASTRLRVIIPARQLAKRFPVWLVPFTDFLERPGLEHLGRPHAIVISKLSSADVIGRERQLRELLAALHKGEVPGRLFADLSDNYAAVGKALRRPFLAQYQRGLGRSCEFIVPTAALAAAVRSDTRRAVHVIEDPFESSAARPVRVASTGPLRLAWFGTLGEVNFPLVERELDKLAAAAVADRPMLVELVANAQARQAVQTAGARLAAAYPSFSLSFTDWSISAAEAAIERADFVWLPQEHQLSWGRVKSHNRLVSAIRGGRLALASPIPSYEELAPYAWVGEPLIEGLRWALANSQEAAQRVREGQRHIEERFSPDAVGRRWTEVLALPVPSPTDGAT